MGAGMIGAPVSMSETKSFPVQHPLPQFHNAVARPHTVEVTRAARTNMDKTVAEELIMSLDDKRCLRRIANLRPGRLTPSGPGRHPDFGRRGWLDATGSPSFGPSFKLSGIMSSWGPGVERWGVVPTRCARCNGPYGTMTAIRSKAFPLRTAA
jgi:hypothetical protein